MKVSEQIFRLIRSMSASEKRHFKLTMSYGQRSKNYLALYDIIEQNTDKNDHEIKHLFKQKGIETNYNACKNYLLNVLLRSIDDFDISPEVNTQIMKLLITAEQLTVKRLYDMALHRVMKAEELAIRFEHIFLLPQIMYWKRKLWIKTSYNGITEESLTETHNRVETNLKQLSVAADIDRLHKEMIYQVHISNYFADPVKKTMLSKKVNAFLNKKIKPLSFHAQRNYLNTLSLYYDQTGCFSNDALQIKEQELTLLKTNEHKLYKYELDALPGALFALSNHYYIVNEINKLRELNIEYKKILKRIPEHYLHPSILIKPFENDLLISMSTNDHRLYANTSKSMYPFLERTDIVFPETMKMYHMYDLGYAAFVFKENKRALQFNSIIINNKNITHEMCFRQAQILNVLIHFELHNEQLLESASRSFMYYYKNRKPLTVVEQAFLSFLKQSPFDQEKAVFNTYLSTMLTTLKKISKSQDTIFLKGVDLLKWGGQYLCF